MLLPALFTAGLCLVTALPGTALVLGQARACVAPGRGRHRRTAARGCRALALGGVR